MNYLHALNMNKKEKKLCVKLEQHSKEQKIPLHIKKFRNKVETFATHSFFIVSFLFLCVSNKVLALLSLSQEVRNHSVQSGLLGGGEFAE